MMSSFRPSASTRSPRPSVPGSGVITGFGNVSGDTDSRTILLERRRVATLLESDRSKLGLHVDMMMTPDLARAIALRHEYRLAWRAALQRLSRKARTVREIREGLVRRRHHETIIEEVIIALEHGGALDDRRYADTAAQSLARTSPASVEFLKAKLRDRGVPAPEAADAAARAAGDPVEAALALARRALRSLGSCPPDTRRRRLWGRLARRGFDADVISEAFRRLEQDLSG